MARLQNNNANHKLKRGLQKMSETALLITAIALALLVAALAFTNYGFRSRAKDPNHTRRPGDRFRNAG